MVADTRSRRDMSPAPPDSQWFSCAVRVLSRGTTNSGFGKRAVPGQLATLDGVLGGDVTMVDGIYHPGQMSLRNVRKLNEREILQGTKPATNPGAMTRKTAAPTIAKQFPNHVSCKQFAWPCAMEIGRRQSTPE